MRVWVAVIAFLLSIGCDIATSQPAEPLLIDARKFESTVNVAPSDNATLRSYGPVILNAPPYTERPNSVRYSINVAQAGEYQLRIKYAAQTSRPVQLVLNGHTVARAFLSKATGCWEFRCQAWSESIAVPFRAGNNELEISSPSVFPHISMIELQSVNIVRPNVAASANDIRELQNSDLVRPNVATSTSDVRKAMGPLQVDWCDTTSQYSNLSMTQPLTSTAPKALAINGIRIGADVGEWYAAMEKILGGKKPKLDCDRRGFRAVLPDASTGSQQPSVPTDLRNFTYVSSMKWETRQPQKDNGGQIFWRTNSYRLQLSSPISGYRMLAIERYVSLYPYVPFASLEQELRSTHGDPTDVERLRDQIYLTYLWNGNSLLTSLPSQRCNFANTFSFTRLSEGDLRSFICPGVTAGLSVRIRTLSQNPSLAAGFEFYAADLKGLSEDNVAFRHFIQSNQPPPSIGIAPKL